MINPEILDPVLTTSAISPHVPNALYFSAFIAFNWKRKCNVLLPAAILEGLYSYDGKFYL